MKEVIKYIVADKEFNNKEDALKYEDKISNDLYLRISNLIAYYWTSYGYPSHSKAVKLIGHFCNYHKRKLEHGEEFVGVLILNSRNSVEYWLKNDPNFTLNEREQLLMDIDKDYKHYQVNKKVNINLINWEVDLMNYEIKGIKI